MNPCASPKSRLEKELPGYAAGQSPCRGGNELKVPSDLSQALYWLRLKRCTLPLVQPCRINPSVWSMGWGNSPDYRKVLEP